MKTLTLTQAKAKLARVLEEASAGESISITRRGKELFAFNTGDVVIVRQEGNQELLEKGLAMVVKHKARMKPESIKAKLDAVRYGRHGR